MQTGKLHRELVKAFRFDTFREFRDVLVEAKEPFPISLTWKCIAKGRRGNPKLCIFQQELMTNAAIDMAFVIGEYSFIRFKGGEYIFRYRNPLEMQEAIRELDQYGTSSLEEGDEFTLEPLASNAARSLEYHKARREAIKNGTHTVKPRGPNVNPRRTAVHHFRPY